MEILMIIAITFTLGVLLILFTNRRGKLALLSMATILAITVGCSTESIKSITVEEVTGKEVDIKRDKVSNNGVPGNAEEAVVERVVDGDTIKINYNDSVEDVRLLLVDTPETVHPSKPVEPFGEKSSGFAKEMLEPGKVIYIEFDGPLRDHYDRLLGYIWVDGQNFNKLLLENGLARYAYVFDPPYVHQAMLMEAEEKARKEKLGVWSIEGYVTPDGFSTQ